MASPNDGSLESKVRSFHLKDSFNLAAILLARNTELGL